jgi:molybdopterin-guanine dinucleotide biosynthesis protein A
VTKPLGVILAGGLASRMGGGDKALLELGSERLIDLVISRISPQVAGLAINANGDPSRFSEFDLPVLPDSIKGFAGPLAGVLAGLDWAAENEADAIVTVAADTPFFPLNLVAELEIATKLGNTNIALATTPDPERGQVRHPTFGIWPVSLRDDLRSELEDGLRKVVLWTDKHDAASALFQNKDRDPFFNVNTPDDLKIARQMLAGNTE